MYIYIYTFYNRSLFTYYSQEQHRAPRPFFCPQGRARRRSPPWHPANLSIYLSIYLSIRLSIYLSIHPGPSIYLSLSNWKCGCSQTPSSGGLLSVHPLYRKGPGSQGWLRGIVPRRYKTSRARSQYNNAMDSLPWPASICRRDSGRISSGQSMGDLCTATHQGNSRQSEKKKIHCTQIAEVLVANWDEHCWLDDLRLNKGHIHRFTRLGDTAH